MRSQSREKLGLDGLDREILGRLREDARISYRALGQAVGLSANAVADRVRRLRRRGVIAGFTAVIDPVALGHGFEALVDVRLAPGQDDAGFESAVATLPGVIEDLHVTGPTDHQLRVACDDVADLNRLLRTLKRECGVAHSETRVILRESLSRRTGPGALG